MPHANEVRAHARWRPGWHSGRRGYAWLLSLADQQGLRQLVNQYQYALRDLPGFDLVPLEWMHILVQDIGFADEVSDRDLTTLVAGAGRRLAGHTPPALAFQHALVLPESLALPAEPQSALTALRTTLREITAETLGPPRTPGEPEPIDQHVSLAYSSATGPAVFAKATLEATEVTPATTKIGTVSLVRLTRDYAYPEWDAVTEVPFGD